MKTKNGIKFYQVLVTDWHESSLYATYKHVFNYATLAEAMQCSFYVCNERKHTAKGEKFIDTVTGEEKYQYHFQYLNTQKQATIELRHEKITKTKKKQKYFCFK